MATYSLQWLREQYDLNKGIDFLFFWGHSNKEDLPVGNFIFSQWYLAPFTIGAVTYQTAEHWMMAEKARLFRDAAMEKMILQAPSPKEAKALGRKVRDFDPAVWNSRRFGIVVEGNKEKFIQNKGYAPYLLATSAKVIVEASPTDTIWGIGLSQHSAQALNPHTWRGSNLLGFALMEVRDWLQLKEGAGFKQHV